MNAISGDIETSVNYGMGYSIIWEPQPYSDSLGENRYGAYLEDILCACIDRIDSIQISKYSAEEYDEVKKKLLESLDILKNKAEGNKNA
jgi:hypothetical protein